jgi:Cd2+/Zn2+-exporting ATPase
MNATAETVDVFEIDARVARLLEQVPAVKQLRADEISGRIDVAFYYEPSPELLMAVEGAVRAEFGGHWKLATHNENGAFPFHRHLVSEHISEFHRPHPAREPRLIWRRIRLPRWRQRPSPPSEIRDYRVMLILAVVCGAATLAGFALSKWSHPSAWLTAPLFITAYIAGGWFATIDVAAGLKERRIDIHFLMVFVAVGAAFVQAWTEGAVLLFLFSLSSALEQFANHRTRCAIESLLHTAPPRAWRRKGESWIEVDIDDVTAGDELLVKAGELFPVDGIVIEGATSADESALSGESLPVPKTVGDSVSGGTLNLEGRAVIRASAAADESSLRRILDLIENAQLQKAPAQRFTDTFSRYYTWGALVASLVLFAALLITRSPFHVALYRTMTLLVVASPCALVLSIPSAILVAIASGARQGILFRGGVAIETLAAVRHFAFDKTGTLTKGALVVASVESFAGVSQDDVLRLAAAAARFSTHPLAHAITRAADDRLLSPVRADDFINFPGFGMQARVNGEIAIVGSRAFMAQRGIDLPEIASTANAEVWVATDHLLGLIRLADEVRPEAAQVITFLKQQGIRVSLLTGDRASAARAIARAVGIYDVHSSVSPEEKLQCVHRWRQEGRKVAMVGDGINDAPSLAAADVALGMGARGSDAALEQADVILMHDKIENVEDAWVLSRRARSVIRQNLVVSLGVVLLLVVSALAQKINLTLGVIGHEGSTVLVVLNGLRLLRRHSRV